MIDKSKETKYPHQKPGIYILFAAILGAVGFLIMFFPDWFVQKQRISDSWCTAPYDFPNPALFGLPPGIVAILFLIGTIVLLYFACFVASLEPQMPEKIEYCPYCGKRLP